MARKPRPDRTSHPDSAATSASSPKKKRTRIPDAFQRVCAATIASHDAKISVPMLVLYGEWLKAAGFPIGSAAVVTADARGELALSRIGLGKPRRVYIRATPR